MNTTSQVQCKSEDSEEFFVYVDYTKEEHPRPYYVGKGDRHRLSVTKRNSRHEAIVAEFGLERIVVFSTFDEIEAFLMEMRMISELHTYHKDPLATVIASNFTLGGNGARGIHTVETLVHCPTGEVVKFSSVHAAATFTGVDPGVISRIITGRGRRSKVAGGYTFAATENRPRKRSQNRRRINCTRVAERDKRGEIITIHESIGDAARSIGVSRSVMSRAIHANLPIRDHTFTTMPTV
jgi:hypothetical protein